MKFRFLALLPILALTGCATRYMSPAEPARPADGKAVITFYRKTVLDADFTQAPIVEKTRDSIKLVGISSTGTKIQHEVTPGEHTFAVGGESGHFMKATVEAGKSYYVHVAARMGFWKVRYKLLAQKGEDISAAADNSLTIKTVRNNDSAALWFRNHKESLEGKYAHAAASYARKPEAPFTLEPEDGILISEDPNFKKQPAAELAGNK